MAFTNYSIIPSDGTVVIDGQAVAGVSMTEIPLTVHAIQWYGLQNQGTVEYRVDPETGVLPAPGTFTDPADYAAQTDEAEAIIYARNNPVTYYRTTKPVGQPVIVTTVGWPQPDNTTTEEPPENPSPESSATLYWDGNNFVWLTFPVGDDLSEAKQFTINTTDKTAYYILLPTDWYVVRRSDDGTPIPQNIDSWRSEIRSEAKEKVNMILSTVSLEELNSYTMSEEYLTWAPEPSPLV